MGIFKWLLALVLILSFSYTAHAEQQTVCGSNPPPGFVAINLVLDYSCGPGPYENATVAVRFDNLPVGANILQVCYYEGAAIPAGWTITRTYSDATRCGGVALAGQINQADIHHASCVNESNDLCYPPSGTISVSPSTVVIPYGQTAGTTFVTYSSNRSDTYVWFVESTANPPTPTLWRGPGATGTHITWPYVPIGTTTFYLTTSSTSATPYFASVVATGVAGAQPTFSITPSHVIVPVGQTTGTFTMNWNAPGYASLDLQGKINNGNWNPPVNVPATSSYGDNIPVGSTYTYRFLPHGDTVNVLGTLTVYASH